MYKNHSVHVCYVSSPYHTSWCDQSHDIWLPRTLCYVPCTFSTIPALPGQYLLHGAESFLRS
jgi:hypothetical protein